MGVRVTVGVKVTVGVSVIVAVGVVESALIGVDFLFKEKYTRAAPRIKKSAKKPSTAGKLSVISGMRDPWTDLADWALRLDFNSLPHTRQRVALSLSLVPQVGHNFVLDVNLSVVIIFLGIYPGLRHYTRLCQSVFFIPLQGSSQDKRAVIFFFYMPTYSLYFHIPFCRHRCAYCDFNTYAGQEKNIPAYVEAMVNEITGLAQTSPDRLKVHTIFFGGGTPSLLPVEAYKKMFDAIHARFELAENSEVTMEANPGTVSPGYLQEIHSLGFTRMSFGMQSANLFELRQLERQHSTGDVIRAVEWAHEAGFDRINLDLIYGLPDQRMDDWQRSLEFALELKTEHLSLYSLTVETGTPLNRWVSRGLVSTPDPDRAADMYEWSSDRLTSAGFKQYEISNWAGYGQDGELLACQHNLTYWRNLPYLGFGAGAHGSAGGYRTANVNGIADYIRRCQQPSKEQFPFSPANVSTTFIDPTTEMQETMMVGLRLVIEGVSLETFQARFGFSLLDRYSKEINELTHLGLLEWSEEGTRSIRLTKRGRLLGNQVFVQFI